MRASITQPHNLFSIDGSQGRPGSYCIRRRNSRAQASISDSRDRRSINCNKTLLRGDYGATDMRPRAGIDLGANVHMAFKGDWTGGHWLLLLK